ncbi:M28 family peptidase [Flagellimonas sp. DF-77]|uniref:M28 family metallopeptidase n=1 Tax=Flagellimonas algarum TaxID=3230298 RepID=UPI003398AB0B
MGKFVLYLVLTFAMTCGSVKKNDNGSPSSTVVDPNAPDGVKGRVESGSEAQGFTDADKVNEIISYLASDELQGRDSGSEGIALAATFIESRFEASGIQPYFRTFRDTLGNFEGDAYNVVGMIEGTDPELKNEFILIGAHYDHIGLIAPENGDAIANGANDNASGTTAVLELARYFGTVKNNKRSLIFALFSAEEKGLLGSKHLAKRLKEANLDLYAMLNFEMIGVPLQDKDYELYITGYLKSNLAEISNAYAEGKLIGFLPTAKQYNLFFRSDNYPFFKEFGVPSHTFCTFDFTNFAYYHKVDDEVTEIDVAHMADIINKMVPVVAGITNANAQEIKMNPTSED